MPHAGASTLTLRTHAFSSFTKNSKVMFSIISDHKDAQPLTRHHQEDRPEARLQGGGVSRREEAALRTQEHDRLRWPGEQSESGKFYIS